MKIYVLGWELNDEEGYLPCGPDGIIVCNSKGSTWATGKLENVILEFTYEDAEKAAGRWANHSSYKIIEVEVEV